MANSDQLPTRYNASSVTGIVSCLINHRGAEQVWFVTFFCAKCQSTSCPRSYQTSALSSTLNSCKQASRTPSHETMNPAAHLILRLLSTTQQTSPPGGNKTGLLTLGGVPRDGRSLTNMLVVTLGESSVVLVLLQMHRWLLTPP